MSEDKKQDTDTKPASNEAAEPLLLTDTAKPEDIEKAASSVSSKQDNTSSSTTRPRRAQPAPKAVVAKTPRAIFASALALIAIGIAAAGIYRAETQQQALLNALASKQKVIESQTKQIQTLAEQIQQTQVIVQSDHSASEGMALQLDNLGQVVASNQRRIDSVVGTERSDWQLAEVEYLLRLANQRLMMSGEVRGSKALLQSADAVLVELDDVHMIGVREAIAKDIAALNRADSLDAEGLYLRVASLAESIDYMELRSDKRWRAKPSAMQTDFDETDSMWQAGLDKAMSALSDLVVIRSSEQRVLPQMSDVEVMQLRQGLHFLIEQAKYAVVSGKQDLFDTAIAGLLRWLNSYYDLEQPITAATMVELESLQNTRVVQQWPDISQSLDKLQMLMKSRMGLPAKQSAQQVSRVEAKVNEDTPTQTAQGEQQ